ncbi:MAG: glycine radical domain-containing protein, partial [Candidatus Humimicrobiaceae bacterium]
LKNKVPKYGNDEKYVDFIAKRVALDFINIVSKNKNVVGGKYRVGFNTPSTHVRYGLNTAATPDGRKKGEPLSYGTGPMQGVNTKGYTATIKSVNCFPHYKATLGTDISMSLNKNLFSSREGEKIIKSLIKTHFELGGHHIMFNVVDSKLLRKAQKNPEKYRDLVVRVHGFSAYFVGLSKDIQEDIISRIESGL